MDQHAIQQIRGLKDLLQDAVAAGVDVTENLHLAIARQPYAILGAIPPLAAPAGAIELAQTTLTRGVYASIRQINRVAGGLAGRALDLVK